MLEINAIPALSDNYIWIITGDDTPRAVVVDPGEAAPVSAYLQQHDLTVGAYLITHHHGDHVGGLPRLLETHPAPVHGPAAEADRIGCLDHEVAGGDQVRLPWLDAVFDIIDVPGHTLGHIAYFCNDTLLCGDALFRAGCGRVFEGTHDQMQQSLARLGELPDETRIYGGHEYTQKNLAFAQKVEPNNRDTMTAARAVAELRRQDRPSLPGTLGEERRINPFLRWDDKAVIAAASQYAGRQLTDPGDIFGALRNWKNAD